VVCSHLGVGFRSQGRAVRALDDVSLEAHSGEFLSILGPSGCGKTTLLRAIAGLIEPDRGSVERILTPEDRNGRALLVFQQNSLFPWMNVLQNAVFGLEMQAVPRREREALARGLLERLGLGDRERSYPHQLSVGMRQRVAVIRSFLSDPGLLLMDEPFAALDCLTRGVLQQELLDLWEQNHKSVIFVTHDVEEAILLSDRILVLSPGPGTIVAEFPILLERPRTAATVLSDEVLLLKRKIHRTLGMSVGEAMHAS
jgi:ABC-type nitrate/sulfonate/bicarbonate transport system ATPase subunit